jgi:hypothetical protein
VECIIVGGGKGGGVPEKFRSKQEARRIEQRRALLTGLKQYKMSGSKSTWAVAYELHHHEFKLVLSQTEMAIG